MRRSTDRILTTHTGSLIRTPKIIEGMKARALNRPYDAAQLAEDIRVGVAGVVRKQVEIGIDIPSDGEFGRAGFKAYMNDRLSNLEPRDLEPGEVQTQALERAAFPGFYAQYGKMSHVLWMLPEVSMDEVLEAGADEEKHRSPLFRMFGQASYPGRGRIQTGFQHLRAGLHGLEVAETFIPTATPV